MHYYVIYNTLQGVKCMQNNIHPMLILVEEHPF
jgi:hypothetical protein